MTTNALVTGALGYTGSALVSELAARGTCVRACDVAAGGDSPGVTWCELDLRAAISPSLFEGIDVVFHLAAVVPYNLGRRCSDDEIVLVNVEGTRRVVDAARAAGVRRFVLASSTGVVFAGESIENGDESLPTDVRHNDTYSRSKAEAERIVLAADTPCGMRTVALRPNGIWGPGERHHTPKVLRVARLGLDRVIFGDGARTDFTHRDNLVDAFLAADRALLERPDSVGGKAFFIVDDGPKRHTMRFFDPLLRGLGHRTSRLAIPGRWMLPLAGAIEALARAAAPVFAVEPFLTRADVRKVIHHNHFSSARAKAELGYVPRVGYEEGMAECVAHECSGKPTSPHGETSGLRRGSPRAWHRP